MTLSSKSWALTVPYQLPRNGAEAVVSGTFPWMFKASEVAKNMKSIFHDHQIYFIYFYRYVKIIQYILDIYYMCFLQKFMGLCPIIMFILISAPGGPILVAVARGPKPPLVRNHQWERTPAPPATGSQTVCQSGWISGMKTVEVWCIF